jgi:hypothetical protein
MVVLYRNGINEHVSGISSTLRLVAVNICQHLVWQIRKKFEIDFITIRGASRHKSVQKYSPYEAGLSGVHFSAHLDVNALVQVK